jgi:hypothetical protein
LTSGAGSSAALPPRIPGGLPVSALSARHPRAHTIAPNPGLRPWKLFCIFLRFVTESSYRKLCWVFELGWFRSSSHDGNALASGMPFRGRGTACRRRAESAHTGGMSVPPNTQVRGAPRSGHTATGSGRDSRPALSFKSDETRAFVGAECAPRFVRGTFRVRLGRASTTLARALGRGSPGRAYLEARPDPPSQARNVLSARRRALRRGAAGSRAWRSARRGSTDPPAPARYPSRGCDRRAS